MNIMDDRTLTVLEFKEVLKQVAVFAVNDEAKEKIFNLRPDCDFDDIKVGQQHTAQGIVLKNKYMINPVYHIDQIADMLERADIGAVLHPSDFIKIARIIRAACSAKRSIESCGDDIALIKEYVNCISPNISLEKRINEIIANEDELKDSASDTLRTLRRKIAALNNKLKEKMNSYTRSAEHEKYLQDSIITVREGRFVIPVRAEYRTSVPGLIHDRSASGSTVYIEPFPVVDMNNELKTLKLSERDEVERILKSLTADVATVKEELAFEYEQLIKLDILNAKCDFCLQNKCCEPTINKGGIIDIKSARHPLLDKNKTVPIDIAFGKERNIVVITGPNTGGKTVSMKTVGLFCLMTYSGLHLPCADNPLIAVFDNIFCDLGDEQSIVQSLSTFSSHIKDIVNITNGLSSNSLVLIDEIGAGTDPEEGAALAVGILKYLEKCDCRAIVTTHYSELKEYALISEKSINACMQFDENTLAPTYKLIIGMPGVSNALNIAAKIGLNDFILKNARMSLKDEKVQFERVLMNAEKVKAEAIKELEEIEKIKENLLLKQQRADETLTALNSKLSKINSNAKAETLKIVKKSAEKADELIEELKEKIKQADEAALIEAKRLHNKLTDLQYFAEAEQIETEGTPIAMKDVRIGTEVIVKTLNLRAEIVALPDKKNLVTVGNGTVKLKTPIANLLCVSHTVKSKTNQSAAPKKEASKAAADTEEIRVLGLTVSEAIEVIEPYILSTASKSDKPVLKIVHGKGTGALGKGIQRYCSSNPFVKSFRYGGYGEGESGVTFVEIK